MAEEVYSLYIEKWGYPPEQARHLHKFSKSINRKLSWTQAGELIENPPNSSETSTTNKTDTQPTTSPENTSQITELLSTEQSPKSSTSTYKSPSKSTTNSKHSTINKVEQTITKQELATLHSNKIANGDNNNDKEAEIVQIMGGIDQILEQYLNQQNQLLNSQQINQLHKLIITPSKYPQQTIQRNDVNNENSQFTLLLQPNDTFLNSIFGEEIGMKINNVIWNRITVAVLFALFIIWMLISSTFPHNKPHYIYTVACFGIIFCLMAIVWYIFAILSVNRIAAKMIAKTFEFYFKMWYAVIGIIAFNWYWYIVRKEHRLYITIGIIETIMFGITMVLMLSLIFMFDGLQYNIKLRKFAIGINFVVALFFGCGFIYHQFLSFSDHETGTDPSIIEISSNIKFSLISIIAKSSQISCIFLFKQVFYMYYRMKKKEYKKSLFIKISANLEWNETGSNEQMMSNTSHNDQELEMPLLTIT